MNLAHAGQEKNIKIVTVNWIDIMAIGDYSETFDIVPGVRLAATASGIKKQGPDLVLMNCSEGSQVAGVFTTNWFAAAPVQVCRDHLQKAEPAWFLVNSGNANAATGQSGIDNAILSCKSLAAETESSVESVLPFSTGVIGETLPVAKINAAMQGLVQQLDEGNWLEAARGIMTTDTRPKIGSRKLSFNDREVVITGIAKGAGMIEPHMATLLVFLATDAKIPREVLQRSLLAAVNKSFNRITVDSDTSTNDSCMLIATGKSGVELEEGSEAMAEFQRALTALCIELAQSIIKDAEGVSRFVEVSVEKGANGAACLEVAYAIANSPLVKTAIFAGDANWGRIVMAIGKSAMPVDVQSVDLYLGDVCLMRQGQKAEDYTEARGAKIMENEEIGIRVVLNAGEASEKIWTTDLSYDYIKINADYRT